MSKTQIRLVLPALVTLLGLVGCGGPSEDDVRQAFYVSTLKPLMGIGGKSGQGMSQDDQAMLKSIHLIGCDKVGTDTYSCHVTGLWGNNSADALTLVKGDSGWVLADR